MNRKKQKTEHTNKLTQRTLAIVYCALSAAQLLAQTADPMTITQNGSSSCNAIFTEDFSREPGWIADDPTKLHWEPASGTLHGTQVNTEGTYAFINLPQFNPNQSWRLEWDHIINSDSWSAGLTFGLFDERLLYPFAAGMDMGIADGGYGTSVFFNGSAECQYNPPWSPGVWYRSVLRYDAAAHQLSLSVAVRSTGNLLVYQTQPVAAFPGTMTRLGVSRLHMKNTGSGADPNGTVDYNLDNIRLCQDVPSVEDPCQLAERLSAAINAADLGRNTRPLIASLEAACASFHRGNLIASANQLRAFQNKVSAQVMPINSALAEEWILTVQQVIEGLRANQ